jgi:hypothetical protein
MSLGIFNIYCLISSLIHKKIFLKELFLFYYPIVAEEELGWSAAWGMSGLHSQRDVFG